MPDLWNQAYVLSIREVNRGRISESKELPITTGANDSHRDKGICWPKTNWEAAALKNGSKAAENTSRLVRN